MGFTSLFEVETTQEFGELEMFKKEQEKSRRTVELSVGNQIVSLRIDHLFVQFNKEEAKEFYKGLLQCMEVGGLM